MLLAGPTTTRLTVHSLIRWRLVAFLISFIVVVVTVVVRRYVVPDCELELDIPLIC